MQPNDRLSGAVEALLEELTQQQQEVAETKKTINMLRRRMGEEPMFTDIEESRNHFSGPLRPDEYYGKPLATAMQSFLERGGGKRAVLPEDILKGLEQGGFDFKGAGWKDSDRLRNLAVALAKNTKTFHRLPNGLYGLRVWYDEAILKKSEKVRQGAVDKAASDTAETTEEEESIETTEAGK